MGRKREIKKHEWFPFITTAIKKFSSAETPEEIREGLKEEWSLINDFFRLYEEKINDIKKAVDGWKSSSTARIEESQDFIKDVYKKINPLLEKKIKILLAGIEGIDRKVFARIKRAYNLKDTKSKEQLEELQRNVTYYTKQIRDNLSFLKKLYKHQTSYLRDKGAGQIEGDLEQHSFLYRTLTDELRVDRRLKRNMIGFLRLVQLVLNIERRSAEYLNKIPEDERQKKLEEHVRRIQDYVGGYRVEEILNPSDRELALFYAIMEEMFGEDELDEMDIYTKALKGRFGRRSHKECVTHIILLKKENRIVGGMLADFAGCGPEKELAIGILWYDATPKAHRKEGFSILMDFVGRILEDDRAKLWYKKIGGIFFEMEKRRYELIFKEKAQFLGRIPGMILMEYTQPKLERNKKPVYNLKLYFYPMKAEWKYKIPILDFANMLKNFMIAAEIYWVQQGYEPERDPSVLYMLRQLFEKVPDDFYKNPDYTKLKPKKDYVELIY